MTGEKESELLLLEWNKLLFTVSMYHYSPMAASSHSSKRANLTNPLLSANLASKYHISTEKIKLLSDHESSGQNLTSSATFLTRNLNSRPLSSASVCSLSDSVDTRENLRQTLTSTVKLSGIPTGAKLSINTAPSLSKPCHLTTTSSKPQLGTALTLTNKSSLSTKSNLALTGLTTTSSTSEHHLSSNQTKIQVGPSALTKSKVHLRSSIPLSTFQSHPKNNKTEASLKTTNLLLSSKILSGKSTLNGSSYAIGKELPSTSQSSSTLISKATFLTSSQTKTSHTCRSISSQLLSKEVHESSQNPPSKHAGDKAAQSDSQIKPITDDTKGAPKYNFSSERHEDKKKPLFISPELDATLQAPPTPAVDIIGLKTTLLNAVATSLLSSPDFHDPKNPTHQSLSALAEKLSHYDPEFLLKLALYTRLSLNIRTTANFLLALAAKLPHCRPYLRKYFSATVRLPSDWIEVAEIYQGFQDESIKFGALPTALRKVMSSKFTEFDAFQLAKYNKNLSKKKKPKVDKEKEKAEKKVKAMKEQKIKYIAEYPALGLSESNSESDENSVISLSDTEEEIQRLSFTLKQLIRKIHISEPVEHVMCLVGKKYPEDAEAFRKSRLPGIWDQEKAGKRMKLPVPETWETQISTNGNRAWVWQNLMDNNKLPFMAMLRNIRNIIMAGVSPKHHQWVINKLNDERAVVNSKQFPFRFFSAYEVLSELEKKINDSELPPSFKTPGKDSRKKFVKKKKNPPRELDRRDKVIIDKYYTALDNALKIAICYNVMPISGSSLILCDVGSTMDRPCTAARGLGKPRKIVEVGVLLGLMCKYSCERSSMIVYGQKNCFTEVELKEGSILDNVGKVMFTASNQHLTNSCGMIPFGFLTDMLIDRRQIDNIILLSDAMKLDDKEGRTMMDFLRKYRHLVNPDLLFVSVDLSGERSGISSTIQPEHPNDIYLAGYSDQILRFIAERGNSGQMTYVENIDKAFNLAAIKPPSLSDSANTEETNPLLTLSLEKTLLSTTAQGQKWRTVRVFISSTFRDMHGERDLLTRFVFPELRARAHSQQIHVYEVDLRWGVTEQDARSHKALEICLEEISRSQYFIGLLGQRYGWIQDEYQVPDTQDFDWLKDFPRRKSITEIEMYHAALFDVDRAVNKAFFYFRDPSFLNKVTPKYKADFDSESEEALEKIETLKSNIRLSGLEVYDNYPCHWLGAVEDKPMVGGLEGFGQRVLYNLWNAIQRDYPEDKMDGDAFSQATAQHNAFEEARASNFIGRKDLLQKAKAAVEDPETKLVLITGKPGCGKSAFMAALAQQYMASRSLPLVLSHFIGAAPDSANIVLLLTRLCHEMKRRFRVNRDIPEDYADLARDWWGFLEDSVVSIGKISSKIVVLIDGLDLLEEKYNARSLDWIPEEIPDGVVLLVSGVEGSLGVSNIRKRSPLSEIVVGPLDMFDKAEMVRKKLLQHRKTLDESPFNNQMKLLLTKKDAMNPLYLHLACEELRVFGVFEEVSLYLKKMPSTITNLLQNILERLEVEHTVEILSMSLIFLTLVRSGLLEYELTGVLELAIEELHPQHRRRLPPMVVSKLLRSLQTFLQPTGRETEDLLTLAHRDIERAVKARYIKGAAGIKESKLHMLLARFFKAEADPLGNGSFKGNSMRAFQELPHHLMEAGAWKELEQVVCNINFVMAKCKLGLAQQLLEDYTPGLSTGNTRELAKFIQQPAVLQFKSFVSRNLHILLKNPSLALQQALNEPTSSKMASEAKAVLQDNPNAMMVWVNKPENVNPCQMNISSQTGPVLCIDVSIDCSLFVAGFKNGAVRVYELVTGNEVHTFIGHAGGIADVCFVGSQNSVCSASHDNTLSLWDTKLGIRIATLKGHSRGVHGCAADRGGKNVVSVSWDTSIKVWDGRNGKLLNTLKTKGQHNTPINCVSFHPEGQLVAVGSWDKTLKIWDIYNTKRLKVLKGHRSSVQACAYAPSGRHIVSASLDGEVKIWSTKSGRAVGSLTGHHSPVNDLAFTPNGQFLVTGSSDKVVMVWSGSLGQPINSIGHADLGFVHQLVFDHESQSVGVGYHDGHVRQFNIQTGAELFAARPHSAAIVGLAHHSNLHMSASADAIKIWDFASLPKNIELKGHTSPITCAVWEKNGFASASEDFSILVWPHRFNVYSKLFSKKPQAGRKRNKPNVETNPSGSEEFVVKPIAILRGENTGKITSIAFSCDGTKMVAVSHDQSITVWSCLSHQQIQVLHSCHKDWITTCSFSDISPDILVTGSSDFTLKVWDMKTGTEKTTMEGHTSAINSVSFSQGCVVSAAFDGSVKVWSHKGVEITTLFCHQRRVNATLLHIPSRAKANQITTFWADVEDEVPSDSKLNEIIVLTGSDDGTVGVWKPFVPNEITSLIGHSDRVLSVATTFNNQFLSSSLDGSIRLWNPPLPTTLSSGGSFSLISTFRGHIGPVASVSALSVGENLSYGVSGGRDGCAVVWKITNEREVTKLYHVKVSEKAVSSILLTKFQSNHQTCSFVVGTNTGSLDEYTFSHLTYPRTSYSLEPSSLFGQHPISKLALMSGCEDVIVAGSWSNNITTIGRNKKAEHLMVLHEGWIMDLITVRQCVYSIGLDSNLYCWIPPSASEKFSSNPTKHSLHSTLQEDKRSAWPLSVCEVQGTSYLAISDSRGKLSLWNQESKKVEVTKKLHNRKINAVVSMDDGSFLTGSDDSTVKVWKIEGKGRGINLVQIGQFYCQSCVTTISQVRREDRSKKNQPSIFIVGDSLGHVILLQWKQ